MNIKELKVIIDTAIELGHGEAELVTDESRDGQASYHHASARFEKGSGQAEDNTMLVIF